MSFEESMIKTSTIKKKNKKQKNNNNNDIFNESIDQSIKRNTNQNKITITKDQIECDIDGEIYKNGTKEFLSHIRTCNSCVIKKFLLDKKREKNTEIINKKYKNKTKKHKLIIKKAQNLDNTIDQTLSSNKQKNKSSNNNLINSSMITGIREDISDNEAEENEAEENEDEINEESKEDIIEEN